MKNEKIIEAWDKMKPGGEIKQEILNDITQKHNQRSKLSAARLFRPAKIIAAAAAILLVVGLINIQTVIAFISGLIYVPGVGLTDNENVKYYGLEEPVSIATEYGVIKIEYISKITQGDTTELNILMTTKDCFYAAQNEVLSSIIPISVYSGELIFDESYFSGLSTESFYRTIPLNPQGPMGEIPGDYTAFFINYKNFPDINEFDIKLGEASVEHISLTKNPGEFALSKENNGVTYGLYKIKGSESLSFNGIYGIDFNESYSVVANAGKKYTDNYIYYYDGDGNTIGGGAYGISFGKGYSILNIDGNTSEIKGLKADHVLIDYHLTRNIINGEPVNRGGEMLIEIPVLKDGETMETDIQINIGKYVYKITELRREENIIYYKDNAVNFEEIDGAKYDEAVKNQEYIIHGAYFIDANTSEIYSLEFEDSGVYAAATGGEIRGFDENAETISLVLRNILIYQFGDFSVEFD